MLPDRVSNPGPLTYESGALPIALRGPADVVKRRRILMRRRPSVHVVSTSIRRRYDVDSMLILR